MRTPVEKLWALGYVQGVVDAWDKADPGGLCFRLPARVTVGQAKDIVEQYLVRYPESRHNPAHLLVRAALAAPYPCAPEQR